MRGACVVLAAARVESLSRDSESIIFVIYWLSVVVCADAYIYNDCTMYKALVVAGSAFILDGYTNPDSNIVEETFWPAL